MRTTHAAELKTRSALRPLLLAAVAVLAGCQAQPTRPSSDGTAPLEEARRMSAEFEAPAFTAPPRSIDDVREKIGEPRAAPDADECAARQAWMLRAASEDAADAGALRGGMTSDPVLVSVDAMLARGWYRDTERMIRTAISKARTGYRDYRAGQAASVRSALKTRLGSLQAATGNPEAARRTFASAATETSGLRHVFLTERRTYFSSWGKAVMASWEGDAPGAERELRVARTAGRFVFGETDLFAYELAQTLLEQGRLSEAELEARRALKLARRFGNGYTATTARPTALLADIVYEQGHLADAQFLARAAVNMHEVDCTFPDGIAFAGARQTLARVLAASGAWDAVLTELNAIESALAEQPGALARLFGDDPDWPLALIESGNANRAIARIERATPLVLARHGPDSLQAAELRGLLAMAFADQGRDAQALNAFRAAVPRLLASRFGQDGTFGRPSRDARLRRILESYAELLVRQRASAMLSGVDVTGETFRLAEAARGRAVQAAVAAAGARAEVADPELAALVRDAQDVRFRLRFLTARLRDLDAAPPDQRDAETVERVRADVVRLRAARATLLAEIESRFPDYARLVDPRPATLAQARAALRPDEALIATWTTPTQTLVWALRADGHSALATAEIGAAALAAMVADLRESLDPDAVTLDDIPPFDVETAHALYSALLEPLADVWRPARSLLVVADGPLAMLPLSVLATRPTEIDTEAAPLFAGYREVAWLARSHAVTTLPSTATLVSLRARSSAHAQRQPFIGFGDPVFDRHAAAAASPPGVRATRRAPSRLALERRSAPATRSARSATLASLPPLPDTAEEIRALADTLGGDPVQDVFLGERASERLVRTTPMADRTVVAFATHGLVAGDLDGLTQSALALSAPPAGGQGDGLLTVEEILGLDLDADWVVLSACNTAAADGAGADAVSGLGRAFFYAGARSLVVTHWPVETTSARALTTSVFENARPGVTRAEALRSAMVNLLDSGARRDGDGRAAYSYAHPIFWAAFSLTGDGG